MFSIGGHVTKPLDTFWFYDNWKTLVNNFKNSTILKVQILKWLSAPSLHLYSTMLYFSFLHAYEWVTEPKSDVVFPCEANNYLKMYLEGSTKPPLMKEFILFAIIFWETITLLLSKRFLFFFSIISYILFITGFINILL